MRNRVNKQSPAKYVGIVTFPRPATDLSKRRASVVILSHYSSGYSSCYYMYRVLPLVTLKRNTPPDSSFYTSSVNV
jgi:hypothetical protein